MAQESKMLLTPRAIGVQKDFRGCTPEECVSVWATKPNRNQKAEVSFDDFLGGGFKYFLFSPLFGE